MFEKGLSENYYLYTLGKILSTLVVRIQELGT